MKILQLYVTPRAQSFSQNPFARFIPDSMIFFYFIPGNFLTKSDMEKNNNKMLQISLDNNQHTQENNNYQSANKSLTKHRVNISIYKYIWQSDITDKVK